MLSLHPTISRSKPSIQLLAAVEAFLAANAALTMFPREMRPTNLFSASTTGSLRIFLTIRMLQCTVIYGNFSIKARK